MKIKQGDIFLRDENIYVVDRVIDRLVYLTRLARMAGSDRTMPIQTLPYFKPAAEKYFINKLTI